MKLYLKGKVITKELLLREVYACLKKERRIDLLNKIEEGIYRAKSEEDAVNFLAEYFDIC